MAQSATSSCLVASGADNVCMAGSVARRGKRIAQSSHRKSPVVTALLPEVWALGSVRTSELDVPSFATFFCTCASRRRRLTSARLVAASCTAALSARAVSSWSRVASTTAFFAAFRSRRRSLAIRRCSADAASASASCRLLRRPLCLQAQSFPFLTPLERRCLLGIAVGSPIFVPVGCPVNFTRTESGPLCRASYAPAFPTVRASGRSPPTRTPWRSHKPVQSG